MAVAEFSKRWWRCRYVLAETGVGRFRTEYLLPAGSPVEVELFSGFGEEADRNSLAADLAGLPSLESRGRDQLTEQERSAFVGFANRWGLLGLFFDSLVLQRYIPDERGWITDGCIRKAPVTSVVFENLTEAWELRGVSPNVGESVGQVWARGAGAVPSPEMAQLPAPLYYRQFFPGVSEHGPFPHFGDAGFWAGYSEDFGRFLMAVQRFQRAFRSMEDGSRDLSALAAELGPALKSIHPELRVRDDGTPAMAWHFPSLLSVAYFQLFHRALAGRFPRFCKFVRCGRPFVPANTRRVYCSPECENRAVQRRNKERRPGKTTKEDTR